jgi:hypothetical protein
MTVDVLRDETRLLPLLDFCAEIRDGRRCVYCGRRFGLMAAVSSRPVGVVEDPQTGEQVQVFACSESCYRPGPRLAVGG